MAHVLFKVCVLFSILHSIHSTALEDELPDLKIFGIEKFCASYNYHHAFKTSKLICLLCKGFDMSCLFKTTTTTAATTSSTDSPTSTSTTSTTSTTSSTSSTSSSSTTTSPTTITTPKSTDTTTSARSTESTTGK